MTAISCERVTSCYARALARAYLKRAGIHMPEESPLVRQWLLLKALCARRHGVSAKEMVAEMGVSDKTIRRDLETFQRAGFPLEEIVGEFGRKRWRIDPAKTQPGLAFTFDEAIALYMGRRLLEPLAGTLFWEASQRAFKKVRASLGTEALKYIQRFAGVFHQTMVGASDYSKKAELIDELMIGIEDNRAVMIAYQSLRATEPVTYDVYPYGITYHRGSLYLIGWAPDHEETRHWKVDRMEKAEVTKFPFQRPDDFDLNEHLANSFGVFHGAGEIHVKVRFSSTVARYVRESQWHASQELTDQPDGGVVAEFQLASTEEIIRWVMSFGRHAEVLEPEVLRREMREEFAAVSGVYGAQAKIDGKSQPIRRQGETHV